MSSQIFRIIGVVVSVLFLAICTLLFLVYIISSDAPLVKKVSSALPAASVGGKIVSVGDIAVNTEASRTFYEGQNFARSGVRIDFTTTEGKKRLKVIEREVLNNLIEAVVIKELAEEAGITLTQEGIAAELESVMQNEGGNTQENIQKATQRARLYGWSLVEFSERIVGPALYREQLEAFYDKNNPATDEMQATMQQALAMIADGRSFADAAREHSAGSTANEGGVRGFFARGQLDPEIEEVIFAMEVGEISEVIETETGLHLMTVTDERREAGGEREQVSLSHIFLPKISFARYIGDALAQRNVRIFLPDYRWNQQERYAVFDSPSMVAYQEKIYKQVLSAQEQQAVDASVQEAEGEGEVQNLQQESL